MHTRSCAQTPTLPRAYCAYTLCLCCDICFVVKTHTPTFRTVSNIGMRTNLMNPIWAVGLVTLSLSINGATGSPSVFSLSLCQFPRQEGLYMSPPLFHDIILIDRLTPMKAKMAEMSMIFLFVDPSKESMHNFKSDSRTLFSLQKSNQHHY